MATSLSCKSGRVPLSWRRRRDAKPRQKLHDYHLLLFVQRDFLLTKLIPTCHPPKYGKAGMPAVPFVRARQAQLLELLELNVARAMFSGEDVVDNVAQRNKHWLLPWLGRHRKPILAHQRNLLHPL